MGRGQGGTGRPGSRLTKGWRKPRQTPIGGTGLVVRGGSARIALADARAIEKRRAEIEGRKPRSFAGAKVEPIRGKPGYWRIILGG